MFNNSSGKDERALAVESASFSLAYKVIAFALLVDVVFRSVVSKEASLDLLGIVIGGGLVATLYQTRHRIATRSWVKATLLTVLGAAVVAAAIAATRLLR